MIKYKEGKLYYTKGEEEIEFIIKPHISINDRLAISKYIRDMVIQSDSEGDPVYFPEVFDLAFEYCVVMYYTDIKFSADASLNDIEDDLVELGFTRNISKVAADSGDKELSYNAELMEDEYYELGHDIRKSIEARVNTIVANGKMTYIGELINRIVNEVTAAIQNLDTESIFDNIVNKDPELSSIVQDIKEEAKKQKKK